MDQTQLDPRHSARAVALQHLFTKLITNRGGENDFSDHDLLEVLEIEDYDQVLSQKISNGVQEHKDNIDQVITELAPAWPIAQIAPVDLVILRIGIWEGFIAKMTPVRVVINECIELAKEFGGETSSSFVNGVLGNLLKNEKLQAKLQS